MRDYDEMYKNKPDRIFLASTVEEKMATLNGALAMIDLMEHLRPGPRRFKALHRLRVAARNCPNAAYNLGNYFSVETEKRRRHRQELAMEMFAFSAEMGLSRLRNPEEPFSKAPETEGALRDIISRALTNIGGKVSNAGRPQDGVAYFRQSILIYPENSNSHVCLGNMGIAHGDVTGVKPLEGIKEWKEASRLGDYCHESANGCACRANVVAVVERLAGNYGDEVASEWVATRYRKSCVRRSDKDVVDVIASGADASMIGVKLPKRAGNASRILLESGMVQKLRKEPLEVRVTVMASAIGSFVNMAGRTPQANRELLAEAKQACRKFEPLVAILAEEDWRYVGPPETDYLSKPETQDRLSELVYGLLVPMAEATSLGNPLDGLIAMMSHLDITFRVGVGNMVDYWLDEVVPGVPIYIPATFVGTPPTQ